MNKDFDLKQFSSGSCYSYIVSCENEALVIDPHISLKNTYADYLKKNQLELKYILDTHTHADHFSLAAVLKKQFSVPVLMHEKAISEVADRRLKDNDEIAIGKSSLKVIYTPGHTDDAVSLYGEGRLFTGDVLLIGSVGRTDFQNGSPESMFDTLQRLKGLPDDTAVFPGHDYHEKRSSTLSVEKAANPFLKEADKGNFVKAMRSKAIPKPFNIDNIIRVNRKGEAVSLEMVSPKEAYQLSQRDPQVKFLDVRSPMEFSQVHIKDSLNIPIDMLSAKIDEQYVPPRQWPGLDKAEGRGGWGGSIAVLARGMTTGKWRPEGSSLDSLSRLGQSLVVFCRTGNRSPMAADMLIQSGIPSVMVMDGGITAWQKERLPVIKGVGGISLERQVRTIAGSLVLFGVIMSWVVPGFIGISIFVSCGLIFAGLTDNCLMGMLLMKLPYNKNLYKTKLGGGSCSVG